ncbi:hypothetical protein GCM10022261_20700 [Brevibacterium daeguense]|uniref:Uncharacterized protein n=1 Tax=Brevibacterium daeguense TaxID=909936 RepID=A0ABP8EKP4_9MICO|nr:hypothetical protein [Brevibacterium daeguense]
MRTNTETVEMLNSEALHPEWCVHDNCNVSPGEFDHRSTDYTTGRSFRRDLGEWTVTANIEQLDWDGDPNKPVFVSLQFNDRERFAVDAGDLGQLIGFLEGVVARFDESTRADRLG